MGETHKEGSLRPQIPDLIINAEKLKMLIIPRIRINDD